MKSSARTTFLVIVAVALTALVSVQAALARTLPRTDVTISAALARIQHPGGVSDLYWLEAFRAGPTGVYTVAKRNDATAALSNIRHPGFVGAVSE